MSSIQGEKNDIKISVIVPVYNMEKYLPQCLDSIISQTLQDIEIIAVNDGSTDNSLNILTDYQNNFSRLHIIDQANQGAGTARNKGINCAKGKYLIFMDPDDYYPSDDCLETLYMAAQRENVQICAGKRIDFCEGKYRDGDGAGDYSNCKENGVVYSKDYPSIYAHQRYLFSAKLIKKNNIYFSAYRRFEDPPFTVKALGCAGRFYQLDKPVYVHRIGYKQNEYSVDTCIDIMHGIEEVFRSVIQYDLQAMYVNSLSDIVENAFFNRYVLRGIPEIDNTIDRINKLCRSQNFSRDENIFTEEKAEEYVWASEREYRKLYEILEKGVPVILYGAGEVNTLFLDIYAEHLQNVIGIAVSDIKDNEKKEYRGFKVRQIEAYEERKDTVYVVITVGIKQQEEIEKKLSGIGFRHIVRMDWRKMKFGFKEQL